MRFLVEMSVPAQQSHTGCASRSTKSFRSMTKPEDWTMMISFKKHLWRTGF